MQVVIVHNYLSWSLCTAQIKTPASCPTQAKTELEWYHRPGSTLWVNRFEVEISQVHVSVRDYVHGENIFPFTERNFEKLRSQIPMVPLTPGERVCGIIGGGDWQRTGCVLAIHIDGYCSAAI